MIPMTADQYTTIMIFNAVLAIVSIVMGVKYLKESEGGEGDDV